MSVLIPKHGGYRKLKSFQIAQLVADEVASWVWEVSKKCGQYGRSGQSGLAPKESLLSTKSSVSTLSTRVFPGLSANAALVLITVACSLLDRQVERLALDFENEGGFTERLYRVRSEKRRKR